MNLDMRMMFSLFYTPPNGMDIFLMLMIVSDIPKMISCESVSKEKRKVLPVEHHHTFHESVILVAQDVGRS